MRLPRYLKEERVRIVGNTMLVDVRIRWWHPWAWWTLLKSILKRR